MDDLFGMFRSTYWMVAFNSPGVKFTASPLHLSLMLRLLAASGSLKKEKQRRGGWEQPGVLCIRLFFLLSSTLLVSWKIQPAYVNLLIFNPVKVRFMRLLMPFDPSRDTEDDMQSIPCSCILKVLLCLFPSILQTWGNFVVEDNCEWNQTTLHMFLFICDFMWFQSSGHKAFVCGLGPCTYFLTVALVGCMPQRRIPILGVRKL